MPKKPDNFENLRPDKDDLDQPLLDHRNDYGSSHLPSQRKAHPKKNSGKSSHGKPKHNRPHHNSHKANNKPKIGRRGTGTGSGHLPNNNLPTGHPTTPSLGKQQQSLNNLPKQGERLNSDKSNTGDNQGHSDHKHDDEHPNNHKDSDENNDHTSKDNDTSLDKNDHDDSDKQSDKNDQDNSDKDSDKNKDHKDSDKQDHKDTDKSKDKKSTDKDDGSNDNENSDNKDSDDNQANDNKQNDQSQDDNSPLKKFWNFVSGKKPVKNKSFKDLLKGKNKKVPKQPHGPIHNIKDLMDRINRILRRLFALVKLYLAALKVWMLLKLAALVQSILALITHIFQMIIQFFASIWTAVSGFFSFLGSVAATVVTSSIFASVLLFGVTVAGAIINNWQMNNEQSEYDRMCNPNNKPAAPDSGSGDAVTKGGGSWKKKGTPEYKRAHAVFTSWTDRGLSGAAAAGIVGWVTHEGGDFSIIDRAEGHYGNTEASAGISAGNVPIPSGNYPTGGGGIYQFTPYTDFAPLRSKKWLSAAAQNGHVAKVLNNNGWISTSPYVNGTSFEEFAKSTSAPGCVLKWNGYERGATSAIAATADGRKADAKSAYKLFNGADFKFNKKKFNSWYKPGSVGGVTDTGGSTPNDSDSRANPCNPDSNNSDDDDASSNSIVATAAKEVKSGRHPSGAKYCRWYNVSVGTPWCAIFVSWVLHHTKGYEYIPKNAAVAGFASYFKSKHENRSYRTTPKPGWLILFDWNNSHNTGSSNSHIGIVTSVKNGKISTIEGDDFDGGDTVLKRLSREYSVGDKRISMYAVPKKK